MKKITIANEEYTLEYTIKAAYDSEMVEKTILMQTGAYLYEDAQNGALSMAKGSAKALAMVPELCSLYFKAGLAEHHNKNAVDSDKLMFTYMQENKLTFTALYKELQDILMADGFFDLIGLTEIIAEQNKELMKLNNSATKKKTTTKKK